MRKLQWWAVAALAGTIGVALVWAASAQSPQVKPDRPVVVNGKPKASDKAPKANKNPRFMPKGPQTLASAIAARTKVPEKDVKKVLEALGPVFAQQIASGQQVNLPGVGRIEVVTIQAHRGPVNGEFVLIPNANTVQLEPAGTLVEAANSDGAVSVKTILNFQYNNYDSMSGAGVRTNGMRVPSSRIP